MLPPKHIVTANCVGNFRYTWVCQVSVYCFHRRASLIGWKLDLYIMWNSLAQTYRIHKSGAKGVKIDVIFIEYLFFWAGTQKSYLHFYTWISFQLMHYYVPTSNAGQGFPMLAQLYDTRKCNMQLIYWKYKAIHVYKPTRSFTIPFLKIILFWNKICWS